MTNKDLEEALYIASHLQDFTEFKIREVIEGLVKEVRAGWDFMNCAFDVHPNLDLDIQNYKNEED